MAVVQNPIIGRAKQKFSNAIFSTWLGTNVLRSKPLSVANPRTELQIRNRLRIAYLAKLAKSVREIIQITFSPNRGSQTQYNAFTSANYGLINPAATTNPADFWIKVNDILLAQQNLEGGTSVGWNSSTDTFTLTSIPAATRANMKIFVAYFYQSTTSEDEAPAFRVLEASYAGGDTFQIPEELSASSAITVFFDPISRTGYSVAQNIN